MTLYKQERPSWCKHPDCIFARRVMDSICGGKLPVPEPHDGDLNHFRTCFRFDDDGSIVDLKVNKTDLDWMRWVFDALDGKVTSWLSVKAQS